MRRCVIGIDVGTSACKLLALDENGAILATDTQRYPLYHPREGWSEQEPEDWWQAVVRGMPSLVRAVAGIPVAGVSLSGQMHGMVALDADRSVLCRAPLWNDQRTQAQCDEITALAGGLEELVRQTNNQMLTGCTGGKILWLRQTDPARFARVAYILNPKDYVRFRLTGALYTDVSDASGTGFFDVRQRRWAGPVLRAAGVGEGLFAQVAESVEQTGAVTAEAAGITGLPAGAPVFGGGGDAVISTVAMGMRSPKTVGLTLGTSAVVSRGLPSFAENPGGRFQIYCGCAPETWTAYCATNSAGGCYRWLRDTLGGSLDFATLDRLAGATPPGSDGLLFLPYLAGERFPHFDARARGGFIGLDARMGLGHLARAVLEGVCYSIKQMYMEIDALLPGEPVTEITLTGGGARSALWRQMLADVLGLPVRTTYGGEHGGAFGAALLAGVGSGMFSDIGCAMAFARPETEERPEEGLRNVYAESFAKYARMYPALRWSFA